MAKPRKVSNLLALAILGTLIQRPMHPYEMASVIRARGKDADMPIKWGSLYTIVKNLEKHGFIEATGSTREGGRPERTVYRITTAGNEELRDWVRELLATPEQEQSRFKAALSMAGALTPGEAVDLLRQRVDRLSAELEADRRTLAGQDVPRLFLIEDEYDLAIRAADLTWTRTLLDELAAGTFPGIDMWRQFHVTGEVPAELRELVEKGRPDD
ncbi:PadR family transcriptional regulator [Actinocrispum wychmicini]|uniref:DNA-binding PadR family transcriptional regulator n=1 Tax=Actinocrispum wychmicini TaxID=1213861 RepID=A0A4R2J6H6_9PSEU|nr:PadR family transcriptional regulator [Actinocrispum wychmicini]TCO53657.1 DNA-binding PadR family transcriptional regulator [Actinocrispum wychmicini]